jgi:hypothetical protein
MRRSVFAKDVGVPDIATGPESRKKRKLARRDSIGYPAVKVGAAAA